VVGVAAATLIGLAAPASAHHPDLKGWTSCSNGDHVVLWQIGNNYETAMTIATATTTLGGQSYGISGYTSPVPANDTTSATTIVPGGITGTITLSVHTTWTDGHEFDATTSVDIESNCSGATTTTATEATTTTTAPPTTEATTTTTAPPTTEAPTTLPPTTEAPTTTTAPPPTVPPTTDVVVQGSTSTLPPTTTPPTSGETTTVPSAGATSTSTPVTGAGGPDSTTTTGPPGAINLPRTGSDTNYPLLFGAACVGAGALALRRRRAWNR
jgi:LPXTG-motif cell wall-anchored protein